MAMCSLCDPPRRYSKKGILIHQAKVHGIHPQHEDVSSSPSINNELESEPNVPPSESKVCPVPGCGLAVDDLLSHSHMFHPEWLLSNGKFVFEVV